MKPWTHECMLLGPSSNIQGYTKYFDTLKGRVLKHSKIEELPMPVRVIRKIYQWVIIFKQEQNVNKLQFLNRSKQNFDWDNDNIDDNEEIIKDKYIAHPIITANLPGIHYGGGVLCMNQEPQ